MSDLVDVNFYDESTGQFSRHICVSASALDRTIVANTPAGHKPYIGQVDMESQRMDVATGRVVDFRPESPGDDYEWHTVMRRWVKSQAVLQWEADMRQAVASLREIDAKRSRALADHAINPNERSGNDQKLPMERLLEIEAEAERFRAVLGQPKP
jgi:hypothetical protein